MQIMPEIPQNAKKLPVMLLHGAWQSANTWGTTPHGAEGFDTLFLRQGFSVYLIDQLSQEVVLYFQKEKSQSLCLA